MLDELVDFLCDHNNRTYLFFGLTVGAFLISAFYIAYSLQHLEFVKDPTHTDL
jgi:hypothetical protein